MKKIFNISFLFAILFLGRSAFADTTIHLDVETSTGSLYNQNITVTPCDSDNAGTIATTAYCALQQSGLAIDWSWYGTDAFLNSVEGRVNNDNNNGVYWGWFANLNLGQTALNKYDLNEGDSILINYDINPLKIEADSLAPSVGSNVVFTVTSFGYDSSWNPTWNPVSLGNIVIGSDAFALDSEGKYSFLVNSSDPFSVSANVPSFINSPSISISPVLIASGGTGAANPISITKVFSTPGAVSYLESKQNPDGSFGDMLYTDWVAMGLASSSNTNEQVKQKLVDYLKNNSLYSDIATDSERHAMALMALGINPYSGTSKDYISKIISSFDGAQFGDSSLINDDIFALIVLKNAGYSSNDDLIKKDISYVLSSQSPDGSFGGADMTAACLQALRNFQDISLVNNAISLAESYLFSIQSSDGGFGNSFSTSWVLQAISGNPSMSAQISKADGYLASLQAVDGGLDSINDPEINRIWSTAYSIPATLHLSWNNIMKSFDKPVTSSGNPGQLTAVAVIENTKIDEVNKELVNKNKTEDLETLQKNKFKTENKEENPKTIKKPKSPKTKKITEIKRVNYTDNLLEANALGSVSVGGEISESFMHKVAHKITSPFRWLLGKLGF